MVCGNVYFPTGIKEGRLIFHVFQEYTFGSFSLFLGKNKQTKKTKKKPAHFRGQWPMENQFFIFCSACSVCRLCVNFQDLCANLMEIYLLSSCFSPSFHAL